MFFARSQATLMGTIGIILGAPEKLNGIYHDFRLAMKGRAKRALLLPGSSHGNFRSFFGGARNYSNFSHESRLAARQKRATHAHFFSRRHRSVDESSVRLTSLATGS